MVRKQSRLEERLFVGYIPCTRPGRARIHALEGNKYKWGLAFDAGRQALTGSRKVLIGPHLGIIVPWALYARFGSGFLCRSVKRVCKLAP